MHHVSSSETSPMEVEPGLYGVRLIDGGTGAHGVSMLRGWIRPGASHSPHTHAAEEVVTFLSGHGVVTIAGQRHEVGPGDALLIPPNIVHSTDNEGSEDLHFVAAFSDSLITALSAQGSADKGRDRGALFNRLRWYGRRLAHRLFG